MEKEELQQMSLTELHDAVVCHPYRLSKDMVYANDYIRLIYAFTDSFWKSFKKSAQANRNSAHFVAGFIHEFRSAISYPNDVECVLHAEGCIGAIHRFIDTGRFDEFSTYYTGCNKLKCANRARKWIWDESEQTYHAQYTESELVAMLSEIDDWVASHGFDDFGIYSPLSRQYYQDELDRLRRTGRSKIT
ncbi:MAG: hypothetical protein WC525_10050 [Candidatus Thermoplasmatota archaeon]